MHRITSSLILMIGMSSLYANIQDPKTAEQVKQDMALVQSFSAAEKNFSGDIITVGGDPNGCQFSNIQDAIDTIPFAGTGEIHIATNRTYNENLVINDINVSLIGGYEDCTAAGSPFIRPSNNQVTVHGGNSASVIQITGDSQRSTVLLRNLNLIEGLGAAPNTDSAGGGILAYEADVALSLKNVAVRSNDAEYGAGIAIIEGDTDLLLENSLVTNNLAKYGAGIYCSGASGSSVVMIEDSGIIANVANGLFENGDKISGGAGLYLDSCHFSMYSGSSDGGLVGIAANIAFSHGGGVFSLGGSTILLYGHQSCNNNTCIGDNVNPVNISQNVAGFTQNVFGNGGGVFAMDGSKVTVYAGLIENNTANSFAAGLYISRSELTIARLKKPCWDDIRCNYFDGNILLNSSSSGGGAIYSLNGKADISTAYFENNIAKNGAVFFALGSVTNAAFTRIEGAVMNNNGGDATESIIYGSQTLPTDLIHVTIADNDLSSNPNAAIIKSQQDFGNGLPQLSVHSSIIDNPGTKVLTHNVVTYGVDFSCVIANELESLSESNGVINFSDGNAGGAFITQDNPIFLDRENLNYHLAGNSPAIDYCNTPTHTSVLHKDIEFESRGYDDPNVEDLSLFTFYDLGADESYINDTIFKNGFE